jgi:hypothetical protein
MDKAVNRSLKISAPIPTSKFEKTKPIQPIFRISHQKQQQAKMIKMAIQTQNSASGSLTALIKHCPAGEINIAVFVKYC